MDFLRWLQASILVALCAVLYSTALGLIASFLFPDVCAHYLQLDPDDVLPRVAVEAGFDWGLLVAILMGPMLGFVVVRDFNAAIEKPGQDRNWLPGMVKSTLKCFGIIAIAAFSLSGLAAVFGAFQGGQGQELAFLSLMFGHLGVGLIITCGHFFRNSSGYSDGIGLRAEPEYRDFPGELDSPPPSWPRPYRELSMVRLVEALPADSGTLFPKGTEGTIVHVHPGKQGDEPAYMIEPAGMTGLHLIEARHHHLDLLPS